MKKATTKAPTAVLFVRVSAHQLRALDAAVLAEQRARPGQRVSRADIVRMMIERSTKT